MNKKQKILKNLIKYVQLNQSLQIDNFDSRVFKALCHIEKKLKLLTQ